MSDTENFVAKRPVVGKSQLSNLEDPNKTKSPDLKSQIFSKSPKTYLLPQKIRQTTMQLMSESYHIWCYLFSIYMTLWLQYSVKSVTLSVCKVEYRYTQTLYRQFRSRVAAARLLRLALMIALATVNRPSTEANVAGTLRYFLARQCRIG